MTEHMDELDRLIDALNTGDVPVVDAAANSELSGLLNAVTRIRRLRNTGSLEVDSPDEDWPERAVRELARELRQSRDRELDHASTHEVAEASARDQDHPAPTLLATAQARDDIARRRRPPRELAQIAAAILVLVLVGGVLAVALRDQGQDQPGTIGSGARIGTPTAAANAPLPTPDAAGQYHDLTFAQAQQLATFHVARPTWVPPYLQDERISASESNTTEVQPSTPTTSAAQSTGSVQVVNINFGVQEPREFAVMINELKQGTPLGPHWDPSAIIGTTTIAIAGHAVTRTSRASVATDPILDPNTSYVWTDQGTTFQLLALVVNPVTEQDVEHMIASMLGTVDMPGPTSTVNWGSPVTIARVEAHEPQEERSGCDARSRYGRWQASC